MIPIKIKSNLKLIYRRMLNSNWEVIKTDFDDPFRYIRFQRWRDEPKYSYKCNVYLPNVRGF